MGRPPEYKPVTKWLDEVAKVLEEWKYPKKPNKELKSDAINPAP